jgi:hypothetical protein
MSKQSSAHWHGIEDELEVIAKPAGSAENSFDTRWQQAQKVVMASGQVATTQAVEAAFTTIDT